MLSSFPQMGSRVLCLLFVVALLAGCSNQTDFFAEAEALQAPFDTVVSENLAQTDPLLLSLVICAQPCETLEGVHYNDLCAIVFQQVGVGWAAQGKTKEARWAFLKSVGYARRTRQKSGSRLRGVAESCLDADCLIEAVEAARYLRVEDRCRLLAEVATRYAEKKNRTKAAELIKEAEERLRSNAQAGGSAKQRAYRSIALAHSKMRDRANTRKAQRLGAELDPTWPPVVKIRNCIEIAEMYKECGELDMAKEFGHKAETLCRKHPDEQMIVLTAELLSQLGEQKTAEGLVAGLRGTSKDPAQVAQGYGRIGRSDLALEFLDESSAKVRARGLYLTSSYFQTEAERQKVVKMAKSLGSGHKDWQMLQAVADLCARTGDTGKAQRYYLASLKAYQRDWPELWHNSQQRAFVLANYGREMAESELATDKRSLKLYSGLTEPYSWPQELKL